VPGTAVVRRHRQSMKPPVEIKSMNHRPAADCAPASAAAKVIDLLHFVELHQRMFWQFLKCGWCCSK